MENKLPLFIVTGASGSGKTYVIKELRRIMPEFDIFDPDHLTDLSVAKILPSMDIR